MKSVAETQREFVLHLAEQVRYWRDVDLSDSDGVDGAGVQRRLEGLLMSFLVALDGNSMMGFNVCLLVVESEEDRAFRVGEGEEPYPDGKGLDGDLQDIWAEICGGGR